MSRDGLREWRSRSACLTVDPELFFPVGEKRAAVRQMAEAREVCVRCAVRTPCLELALDLDAQHGVWGGTTPEQRREIGRGTELRGRAATLLLE